MESYIEEWYQFTEKMNRCQLTLLPTVVVRPLGCRKSARDGTLSM